MHVLARLRLRAKLGLLVGLTIVTILATIAVAASIVRQRMIEERIDKMHAIVDSAVGIAGALEKRVAAGQLTHEQAVSLVRDDIHAMRFDNGVGYVYAQTPDNIIVFHGATLALEGKPSPATDENGRTVTDIIHETLAHTDAGVIRYTFPKPGQTDRQPKMSYVERFEPWNLIFVGGTYIDDIETALYAAILRLCIISGTILCVALLIAWLINRDVVVSLGRLKSAMELLASGDLTATIPGIDRYDEVGGMAKAALIFKDHMLKEQQLAAGQITDQQNSITERRTALVAMAERIETDTMTALHQVSGRSVEMATTAEEMRASATRTDASAEAATTASSQALAATQTVASAAQQLGASIHEIGTQAAHSAAVVGRAVTAGNETRATIDTLNEEVERIGSVADMIGEIAAKTNLLALNATIEAARAGEAGKGFAVVASEVKALATQTARSTEEIGRHIGLVRNATKASVSAVTRIEQTIGEINDIASSIAAAVEQQAAATGEISRNIAETASAANKMAHRSKYPPAEPGALECWPLKAAGQVADATCEV